MHGLSSLTMSSRIAGVQSLYISDNNYCFHLQLVRLGNYPPTCVPSSGVWQTFFASRTMSYQILMGEHSLASSFLCIKSGCHGKAIHIWWYVHSFGTEFLPRQVLTTAIEYRPMCPFAREDLPTSPPAWCLPDKDRKPTVDSDDGEDASIMVKLACFQLTFATYSPTG